MTPAPTTDSSERPTTQQAIARSWASPVARRRRARGAAFQAPGIDRLGRLTIAARHIAIAAPTTAVILIWRALIGRCLPPTAAIRGGRSGFRPGIDAVGRDLRRLCCQRYPLAERYIAPRPELKRRVAARRVRSGIGCARLRHGGRCLGTIAAARPAPRVADGGRRHSSGRGDARGVAIAHRHTGLMLGRRVDGAGVPGVIGEALRLRRAGCTQTERQRSADQASESVWHLALSSHWGHCPVRPISRAPLGASSWGGS
ncbi:hypothetical protein MAIT1_00199 [Magnetofaba australis IT-1]|uniref:Uncharacterized protein n=1 Tax=Magnetofaba australis IT-1 TaxID=1434232 RepID=A0A1Y2K8U4_9PROT|nr:hypothetical protein MAIT1_00199 [Magnetofaba australis IT-1]